MSLLPFEILRHTFTYLDKDDLLECQLTSKDWYVASVDLLYSKVDIVSDDTCYHYICTISNHPRLGGYLREIDTRSLFRKPTKSEIWDRFNLMGALAKYCPALLKLQSSEQAPNFWVKMSYLGNQGKFSRLQCLPTSTSSNNLESYIYTALLFRRSLTEVTIKSYSTECFGLELNKLAAYQKFLDEINSFSNLRSLSLDYESDNGLSYFDRMIEDCQHLTELNFYLSSSSLDRVMIEPLGPIINPRLDIHELACDWEMIDSEDQLNYLMQKFPSLQSIEIISDEGRVNVLKSCPTHVVSELVRYIVAIPYFDVRLHLRQDDLTIACMEFIYMKDMWGDVSFQYGGGGDDVGGDDVGGDVGGGGDDEDDDDNLDKVMLTISNNCLFIYFYSQEPEAGIEFMSRFGNMIRSFTIQPIPSDMRVDWLTRTLEPCSSLQELSLVASLLTELSFNNITFLQTGLKKLIIYFIENPSICIDLSLERMSWSYPNIKILELHFSAYYTNKGLTTIHMPNSQLDLLRVILLYESKRVAIRLKTDKDINFYKSDEERFYVFDEEFNSDDFNDMVREDKTKDTIYFDITFRSMKELAIYFEPRPGFET